MECDVALDVVSTETLLRFLSECRDAVLSDRRQRGPASQWPLGRLRTSDCEPQNCGNLGDDHLSRNVRSDSTQSSATFNGPRTAKGERSGVLDQPARPRSRSQLLVREPRRFPKSLQRQEIQDLLGSLRSDRDRAMAGLMLFSGLRSAEVPGFAANPRGPRCVHVRVLLAVDHVLLHVCLDGLFTE